MVIRHSVKAVERWMATDSGSQDIGQVTWLEENTTSGEQTCSTLFTFLKRHL